MATTVLTQVRDSKLHALAAKPAGTVARASAFSAQSQDTYVASQFNTAARTQASMLGMPQDTLFDKRIPQSKIVNQYSALGVRQQTLPEEVQLQTNIANQTSNLGTKAQATYSETKFQSSPLAQVSALQNTTPISYTDKVFQEVTNLSNTPVVRSLQETSFLSSLLGRLPGPSGQLNLGGISYFNVENDSTYYEIVGGSTYYVVV